MKKKPKSPRKKAKVMILVSNLRGTGNRESVVDPV
jgi:hypothetical protein